MTRNERYEWVFVPQWVATQNAMFCHAQSSPVCIIQRGRSVIQNARGEGVRSGWVDGPRRVKAFVNQLVIPVRWDGRLSKTSVHLCVDVFQFLIDKSGVLLSPSPAPPRIATSANGALEVCRSGPPFRWGRGRVALRRNEQPLKRKGFC
jgi:hypothetical protein